MTLFSPANWKNINTLSLWFNTKTCIVYWCIGLCLLISYATTHVMQSEQAWLKQYLLNSQAQQMSYTTLLAPLISQTIVEPDETPAQTSPHVLPHLFLVPAQQQITLDGFSKDWSSLKTRYAPTTLNEAFNDQLRAAESAQYIFILYKAKLKAITHTGISEEQPDTLLLSYDDVKGVRKDLMFAMNSNNHFSLINEHTNKLTPIQIQWRLIGDTFSLELKLPKAIIGEHFGFSFLPATTSIASSKQKLDWLGTNPPFSDTLPTLKRNIPALTEAISQQNKQVIQTFLITEQHHLVASYYAGKFHRGEISNLIGDLSLLDLIEHSLILKLRKRYIHSNNQYQQIKQKNGFLNDAHSLKTNNALLFSNAQEMWVARSLSTIQTTNGRFFYLQDQFIPEANTITRQALRQWLVIAILYCALGCLLYVLFRFYKYTQLQKLKARVASLQINTSALATATSFEEVFVLIESQIEHYKAYYLALGSRLSHETRTPVAIIKSALEQLDISQHDLATKKRATDACEHLSDLINAFSSVQQLEKTLDHYEISSVDMSELSQTLIDSYQALHPHLTFTLKAIPYLDNEGNSSLYLNCSDELVAQLLQKILDNACSFTQEGGEIEVTVKKLHSHDCLISIFNPGIVIPDEVVDDIFTPFYSKRQQLDSTSTGERHIGFGLYIAKLIAEFHRGEILARGLSSPKQGTIFEIYLQDKPYQ